MRTRERSKLQTRVCWGDTEHTTLHFTVMDPMGTPRASFFVRLDDLLAELSRLGGVWKQGVPVKTYPMMNQLITGVLYSNGTSAELYAASRIEELERQVEELEQQLGIPVREERCRPTRE